MMYNQLVEWLIGHQAVAGTSGALRIGDVQDATALTEPAEGFDDDVEPLGAPCGPGDGLPWVPVWRDARNGQPWTTEASAVQAARLARMQRQAAREAPPGTAPAVQGDSRARIKALAAAAQRELNEGDEAPVRLDGAIPRRADPVEPEDVAEAWALRQLEVGLHRRRTGQQVPVTADVELEEATRKQPGGCGSVVHPGGIGYLTACTSPVQLPCEISQLGTGRPAAMARDGVAQVRKAAERVAKGHDGAQAIRKEESATGTAAAPVEGCG
eukprot:Skav204538  [mRNA]  locus=scaffold1211:221248:225496:- [translate_table: standard]